MPDPGKADLTELLNRFSAGDPRAESELVPLIYSELRKMAASYLRRERAGHTLQPTALVHEAYLRIAGRHTSWNGREHFFAVAARVMRGILIDHARQRSSQKRGAGALQVEFSDDGPGTAYDFDVVLHVDSALEKLAKLDPRQAKIVEMRYFAGLTEEEIGLLLGVSARTIKRDWTMAKAWLANALTDTSRVGRTDPR
jgi:RNA polymerase sigma factor (TIGR02999 family)